MPRAMDRAERDKALFDEISSAYCRKDLAPGSRRARRHRLMRTLAAVPFRSGLDLLEVGCGAGFAATYLRGMYRSYYGIDYSEKLIDYARHHNGGPSVRFDALNAKDLDLAERFDVVFMIGVLHHMDDMHGALRVLVRALRPGGWIVANEPQPANPLVRLARHLRTRWDRGYSTDQVQLGADDLRELYRAESSLVNLRIKPQGLWSTPFAEIPLSPAWFFGPMAGMACILDTAAETLLRSAVRPFSWNLIAAGQKPG